MKRILSIFCFIIISSGIVCGRGLTKVYVSSKLGDDSNCGNSLEFPLKTISAAIDRADTVLLKAGDYFHEHAVLENTYLSRYGEGPNPTICGYKRIINPNWKLVGENIWRIDLTENNYSGIVLSGPSLSNNVGFIHEYDKDLIHGYKHQYLNELNNDWDFYQSEIHKRGMDPNEFNYLYLYLTINPNELKLEFPIYDTALELRNSTINSINVTGFSDGITVFFSANIINCKIDAIGGRTFLGYNEFVCCGNGIQYWVGNYDIKQSTVEGCYVSRCYDCGITIQGTCDNGLSPHNVTIKDNLIVNCCQGWEDFLHHDDAYYDNCSFENNIVVFSGESGWGYPGSRFKRCHVLQNNNNGLKGMVFKKNVFISGNYYCSSARGGDYSSAKWLNNICYIEEGRFLMGNYDGTRDVIRIPRNKSNWPYYRRENNEAIGNYRDKTKDMTTEFIVVSDRKAKRLGKRAIKNYLKTHTY